MGESSGVRFDSLAALAELYRTYLHGSRCYHEQAAYALRMHVGVVATEGRVVEVLQRANASEVVKERVLHARQTASPGLCPPEEGAEREGSSTSSACARAHPVFQRQRRERPLTALGVEPGRQRRLVRAVLRADVGRQTLGVQELRFQEDLHDGLFQEFFTPRTVVVDGVVDARQPVHEVDKMTTERGPSAAWRGPLAVALKVALCDTGEMRTWPVHADLGLVTALAGAEATLTAHQASIRCAKATACCARKASSALATPPGPVASTTARRCPGWPPRRS